MAESRTKKSLKNSSVALIIYFVNLILQFYSRKIFLEYLGTEILGLNTTATNLLQFLNLAELGIGSAVAYTLYGPLHNEKHAEICEIISLQGWIYKRIAYFIIIGALILSIFFPFIFKKMALPLWYAYACFGVLLFSSLLSYFINYKQIILSADQKDYKIQYSYKFTQIIKAVVQMVFVAKFPYPFLSWLLFEFIFSIISSLSLNYVVKKTYTFLSPSFLTGQELISKYSNITKKIKQLFFHKIGGFVLTQTSPIIIYAFASLTVVALYGNYLLIINGFLSLLAAIFNSMAGGVGNLIAQGNKNTIVQVFFELMSIRVLIVSTCCFVIYAFTKPFITIWLGKEYILEDSTLLLMVCIFFIQGTRHTIDAFINGYGLFGDIWSPIIEAILNIGFSILLGIKYGLNGIIAGVLISLIWSMVIWKPYYLIKKELPEISFRYIKYYVSYLSLSVLWCVCIVHFVKSYKINSFVELFVCASISSIVFSICLFGSMLIFKHGARDFYNRLMRWK